MTDALPLISVHALITRPAGLGESLCAEIKKLGGNASHYPVIQINEPHNAESALQARSTINDYDIAIFISPTSVEKTLEKITPQSLDLKIAAIGSATTSALESSQLKVSIQPEGHDSESLLDHAELQAEQIRDKRIIIFKGEGGRTLLSETLDKRGARVFNADMYRRAIPENYSPLSNALLNTIDTVLISSGEGLKNLIDMCEDAEQLTDLNIIVPGDRIAKIAAELGFNAIYKASDATNSASIKTLLKLTADKHN